jgi:hypothetical protein
VEKASMGTAVGHGSVDPKVERGKNYIYNFPGPKGKRVNIPAPGRSSDEDWRGFISFSSFLTVTFSLSRRRWPWARKEFSLLVKGQPPWNGIIPRKGGSR